MPYLAIQTFRCISVHKLSLYILVCDISDCGIDSYLLVMGNYLFANCGNSKKTATIGNFQVWLLILTTMHNATLVLYFIYQCVIYLIVV